jgi:hypothetical protein
VSIAVDAVREAERLGYRHGRASAVLVRYIEGDELDAEVLKLLPPSPTDAVALFCGEWCIRLDATTHEVAVAYGSAFDEGVEAVTGPRA